MEFPDFLIPILMFCVPLLAAVIDARKKAMKKLAEQNAAPAEEDAVEPAAVPLERQIKPKKAAPAQQEEGVHAIEKKSRKKNTETSESKILGKDNIDKKKLILYSEIMKPKFDE